MIKIYDSAERLFNHNGIKIVHPVKAEITKKNNGDYYAEIEDTIENIEFYKNDDIVRIPTPWGEQGFRITNPQITGNKIEFKAWHLFYDTKRYVIKSAYATNTDCNGALGYYFAKTDVRPPIVPISDIKTIQSTRMIRKTLYEAIEELTSTYNGYWVRDNFGFAIKSKIGQDRGVVLKVGKNITEMKTAEDWNDVCTKVLPYTVNPETNAVIELDETYVELAKSLYDVPYTKIVQFEHSLKREDFASQELFIATIKDWLRGQAQAYLEANKLPKVNYSVSASIDNVSDVGDVIQIKHPKCNINLVTEVISVRYDAIRKCYLNIEFGNFKRELKNLTQTITAETNKHTDEVVKNTETFLSTKLAESTAKINNVLGNSYVIYDGDKILVVDALPKETAKNVIKISNGGIGFGQNGINGTFTSAWTIDGTLNMQAINVINLTASLIRGGTLRLGGVDDANGTFELCDSTNNVIARMDMGGLTVYDKNGGYVKLNGEDGLVGYNVEGKKIYWADGETFHMRNAEVEDQITLGGQVKIVPVNSGDNIGIGFVAYEKENV